MNELRFGGRCERHLSVKPCAQCAAEHRPQPHDLTGSDVRAMLDAMAKELGHPRNGHGGQKLLAGKLGVSESFLSDVLNGRREPTDAILKPLGLERVVIYRLADVSWRGAAGAPT